MQIRVDRQEVRDRLNSLGSEQVRRLLQNNGLPTAWNAEVAAWLGEEEQKDVAVSAKRMAWSGAYAAIAAAAFVLLAVIVMHAQNGAPSAFTGRARPDVISGFVGTPAATSKSHLARGRL